MRTVLINDTIQNTLSTPRLKRFLIDSNGIVDSALSLYERNARIAESFYRPLHCLEVCLRNRLHAQLAGRYAASWHINNGPPFDQDTVDKINAAVTELRRAGRAVTPDGVVAELNFGFWVLLLSRRYDGTIWRSTFADGFREGGKRMSRQRVHNRMDAIRSFRNRVFHHEPIYHLNPTQIHDDIIQAIAWMCPETAVWALEHSRVRYVLDNPWPPMRDA